MLLSSPNLLACFFPLQGGIINIHRRLEGFTEFLGGLVVKNSPAMQETRVCSLGQEDPLEKEMATYSGTLDWEISWTEESGGIQSMELQKESAMT